jgi:hypothetical protein
MEKKKWLLVIFISMIKIKKLKWETDEKEVTIQLQAIHGNRS